MHDLLGLVISIGALVNIIKQDTFVFLERDDVPATNNASEQALRNSIIRRKVRGGLRTLWGAIVYMKMVSILESACRQGLNLFRTLGKAITGQPAFTPQATGVDYISRARKISND